jgi:hypothetical protein
MEDQKVSLKDHMGMPNPSGHRHIHVLQNIFLVLLSRLFNIAGNFRNHTKIFHGLSWITGTWPGSNVTHPRISQTVFKTSIIPYSVCMPFWTPVSRFSGRDGTRNSTKELQLWKHFMQWNIGDRYLLEGTLESAYRTYHELLAWTWEYAGN